MLSATSGVLARPEARSAKTPRSVEPSKLYAGLLPDRHRPHDGSGFSRGSLKEAAKIPVGMAMRPIPAIEVKPPQIFPITL